tara:strand:+ start:69 stop:584 length:516 start_codon:yes stop_codon:yes gene_type:complete
MRLRITKSVKIDQFREELISAGVPVTIMSFGSRDPGNGPGPYPDILLREIPEEHEQKIAEILEAHVPDFQHKSNAIDLVKQEGRERIERKYPTRKMIIDLAEVVGILAGKIDKRTLTEDQKATFSSFVTKANKVVELIGKTKTIAAEIAALPTDDEAVEYDISNNPKWSTD